MTVLESALRRLRKEGYGFGRRELKVPKHPQLQLVTAKRLLNDWMWWEEAEWWLPKKLRLFTNLKEAIDGPVSGFSKPARD